MNAPRFPSGAPPHDSAPPGPERTCVGCRDKASRSTLVRVVLVDGVVVVDEGAALPGRGAWLHREPECLERAVKRRAFARAFRTGVADASALHFG